MRLGSRKWRWLGIGLAVVVGAFVVVRTWVVPAVITSQIRARYHGKVVVKDWWFGLHSSGVSGIELGETDAADSPTWFQADRITTDLSLGRLLHGQVMPSKITIDSPVVDFRLDSKGQPLTKIPVVESGGSKPPDKGRVALPEIVANHGKITMEQQGRPKLTVEGVTARLAPVENGGDLVVSTDDKTWGNISVKGHFDPSFQKGDFHLKTPPGFVADPDRLASIPFVPSDVWKNLEPRGPVDAEVGIKLAIGEPKPVTVHTEITLKGTTARLNSLQAETTETTGKVIIDDATVRLQDLKGRTIDGTIESSGTLEFGSKVPRFDLDLRLKGIDVTRTPESWKLDEVGATGRLSGRVALKVALDPAGPDLTGTTGRAVIQDGSFQGIPVKSLSLGLRADRNELQYETLPEGSVSPKTLEQPPPPPEAVAATGSPVNSSGPKPGQPDPWQPARTALPWLHLAAHNPGLLGWAAYFASESISYELNQESARKKGGIRLPKTITTRIELEDVDLAILLEKAKKYGVVVPVPIAGRFSIKAVATIPLGTLKDLKAYGFRGNASLKSASIDHVDLGVVSVHVELANGVLNLTDFRGQMLDHPEGSEVNPPVALAVPAPASPLPPGAFQGTLHAIIAPRGALTAHFEGSKLPLGEVFAPFLPHPSPIGGDVTLQFDARANLATPEDPQTWVLDGHLDSRRIRYRDAALDEVATRFAVKGGWVTLDGFAARLLGKPMNGRARLQIAAPHPFDGDLTVEGWELAKVLPFLPNMPNPSPAAGKLDARGQASGTLQPFALRTSGAARLLEAQVKGAPVGNLGFHWKSEPDAVVISGIELFAFGGKATGEGKIPLAKGAPLRLEAQMRGIDTARMSAAVRPKNLMLKGLADGHLTLTMPLDASTLDANASLHSPDLRIREGNGQEMAVKSLLVKAVARGGQIAYEATAEGLGGKVRFDGSLPIPGDPAHRETSGELVAVNFRLGDLWKGIGLTSGVSKLDGHGAIDANIRAPLAPFSVAGRGQFEFRDLRYGTMPPLGNLKGVASFGPTGWRVEQLDGDLIGGVARGQARSETSPGGSRLISFDFKIDRVSLARMTRSIHGLVHEIDGFGSLRVAGRMDEALHAEAEVLVPRATVFGIPISDLRVPADLTLNPASGDGSIHSRHWTARAAGGLVRGSAWHRLGFNRAFQTDVQLTGVDLGILAKFHPVGKRPPTGKVSGKVTLSGPETDHLTKMRGRIDLDLAEASLIELPVFKELDKFLGASRGGGLFEDGHLHATIANRSVVVEQLALNGRLIQVHATGSVGFNGNLNLEVLVNTNSIISESGLELLNVIPGLGEALGRGEEAIHRVTAFLENSLLKFRVTGTAGHPTVQLDPSIGVGGSAVGFFTNVFKIPK